MTAQARFVQRRSTGDAYPHGRGIFIARSFEGLGSPKLVADTAKWLGLDWVAPCAIWQHEDRDKIWNEGDVSPYVSALRAAGIEVWPWGYPRPERLQSFVAALSSLAQRTGARGTIVDPEGPWIGASTQQARELMQAVAAATPGLGRAFTSFPYPPWVDLPWSAFAQGATCGMPQLYQAWREQGLEFQAKGVKAYQDAGFRNVVPLLAAYDVTSVELLQISKATPRPVASVGWWSWEAARATFSWWPREPTPSVSTLRR